MNLEAQELTLSDALNVLLRKARSNRLIMRRHKLQMREQERKLQGPVKEFMDYMTRKLKAGISGMKGKTAAQKAKSIVNWDEIRAEGQKILQPAELEVLLVGIDSVTKQRMRKQERIDPIGVEAIAWSQAHTAELVVEITTATMEAIEEIITTGIKAGKSMPAIATELRPIVGLHSQYAGAVEKYYTSLIEEGIADAAKKADRYAGRLHRRRTMTIARTESAFGLTEGQRQGYAQMGVKKLERVEDPDCCEICAEYQGKIYTIAEAEGVLPEHPNCLLPDSFVLPCGSITGATKRWYNGDVLVIETATGKNLTVTPNHPIFSDSIWVPANFLYPGDKIISLDVRQYRLSGIEQNIYNIPTPIEQIVETFLFSNFTRTKETPITAKNFHGDVPSNCQIAIVGTNSFLGNSMNSLSCKGGNNEAFGGASSTLANFTSFGPTQSFSKSNYPSVAPPSNRRFSRHSDKSFLGLEAQSLRARSVNSSFFDYSIDPRRTHAMNLGDFISRQTRFVKFDKIISIHTEHYIGYVYNLQTKNHWYIANGIATHNCEGTWVIAG